MRDVGEPPTLHWIGFQAAFIYRIGVGKGRVVCTFSGCLAFVFWLHDDLAAFADYQEPCGFAVPCGILDNLRNPPNLSASKIRKV